MFESPVKIRDLILFSFFSLIIVFSIFLSSFFDERTKIVFCNVGQGDGAYIRIKNSVDVLIDAGPDRSILSCLGKHMPFWDRKIELAFLSHPSRDHYNGYFFINERYKIDRFITVNSPLVSKTYKKLHGQILEKGVPILFKVAGDRIEVSGGQFIFYWPPANFTSYEDNDYSQVVLFECCKGGSQPAFTFLFTGDATPFVLSRLSHGSIKKIDILKIPHHGSKNGLTKKFLDLADPEVAVISASKTNSYGHPHREILDMLEAKNARIRRTDVDGDIVFELPN